VEAALAPVRVTAIERTREPTTVYNLTVEAPHTYFAQGLAVHNKEDARSQPAPPAAGSGAKTLIGIIGAVIGLGALAAAMGLGGVGQVPVGMWVASPELGQGVLDWLGALAADLGFQGGDALVQIDSRVKLFFEAVQALVDPLIQRVNLLVGAMDFGAQLDADRLKLFLQPFQLPLQGAEFWDHKILNQLFEIRSHLALSVLFLVGVTVAGLPWRVKAATPPAASGQPAETTLPSAVPPSSKKIRQYGRTLYISPKALTEMKRLDEFASQRDYVAEIAGFGLTRQLDEKAVLVVDFVAPREGRVFVIKALFLDQFVPGFLHALTRTQRLSLTLRDGEIALVSDDETYSMVLGDFGWRSIQKYMEGLSSKAFPEDPEAVKTTIKEEGDVALDTDWDSVVAGGTATLTDRYLQRVQEEAQKQRASANYTMHHHPHLGLAVLALSDKSLSERQRYYRELLKFSDGDLGFMREAKVDWFEIRALGTPEDLTSDTETTNELYSLEEVNRLAEPLKAAVAELIELPEEESGNPERFSAIVQRLLPPFEQMAVEGYNARTLLKYVFGQKTVSQYKEQLRLPKDIKSLKDVVLEAVFAADTPLERISALRPTLLRTHAELNTLATFQRVMALYAQDTETSQSISDYISRNRLWDLPIETNVETLKDGVAKLQVLLGMGTGSPPAAGPGRGTRGSTLPILAVLAAVGLGALAAAMDGWGAVGGATLAAGFFAAPAEQMKRLRKIARLVATPLLIAAGAILIPAHGVLVGGALIALGLSAWHRRELWDVHLPVKAREHAASWAARFTLAAGLATVIETVLLSSTDLMAYVAAALTVLSGVGNWRATGRGVDEEMPWEDLTARLL